MIGIALIFGAPIVVSAPEVASAVAPQVYDAATKTYEFSQIPAGNITGSFLEGAAEGAIEDLTPENILLNGLSNVLFDAPTNLYN